MTPQTWGRKQTFLNLPYLIFNFLMTPQTWGRKLSPLVSLERLDISFLMTPQTWGRKHIEESTDD